MDRGKLISGPEGAGAHMTIPADEEPAARAMGRQGQNDKSYAPELPSRYAIREKDGQRELVCKESPSVAVRIERGLSLPEQAIRKSPPGSIYLDGTAQEGPFLDVEKQVYNLDHHQGCVRAFTLATCEQAMVLVRKGLDLQGRDWTVYANEPDLDTVLAIWVLLNHIHINDSNAEIRSRIMPLVRLQGVIDTHGLEMQELCGFPERLREEAFAELELLRAHERALKKEDRWQQIDFLDYTADLLTAVDGLVYSSQHFQDVLEVEELARAEISDNSLAVVCRSKAGIYEIEQYLRRVHGKRLGIIILQKDPRTYTVRQVDTFLPGTLENVYERLNLLDSAVGGGRSPNRWGGSAEVGGSPRATGSDLKPEQIAQACASSFRRPKRAQRLGALTFPIMGGVAAMVGPAAAVYLLTMGLDEPEGSLARSILNNVGIFTVLFCLLSGAFLAVAARHVPKLYGLCLPSGWDWLVALPTALLGGLATGTWALVTTLSGRGSIWEYSWKELGVCLALAASAEVLFRGLVHGGLARSFRTQKSGGKWFVSTPSIVSAVFYAFGSSIPVFPFYFINLPLKFLGALLFGLSAAMARERSESLVPPVLLHWSTLILLILLRGFLPG
ncbi:MAG: CPBP family intramembrane metalloprotease [Acidobacteria bacterium]|nr:CPBP family intramembrane metalloprotease [Acidobacteriota bacterium]